MKKGLGISEEGDRISFAYQKTPGYRSIHFSGVFGGRSPNGNRLLINLFNEAMPLPSRMELQLSEQGELGEEIQEARIQEDIILREVEACLVCDLPTAKALAEWLQHYIQDAEDGDAT